MSTQSSTSSRSSTTSNGLPSPPLSPPEPPVFPYFRGAKFAAHKHEPPTITTMGYEEDNYQPPAVSGDPSHLEWCLANPPILGDHYMDSLRSIEIARMIRCGDRCGAQIVLTADGVVAKLYDPLYYNFEFKANVTLLAERDYIYEAAAYSELSGTSMQGTILPTYHGAWSIDIPTLKDGVEETREVRLIMMEYIPGTSMQDLNPTDLSEEERANIMTEFIEADTDLRFAGVEHEDLEPRNVILSLKEGSETYKTENFRLCVIDYARCTISAEDVRKGLSPKYKNPLFYWPGQFCYTEWGWLPEREDAKDWMWETWGMGGRHGKYVAVVRDPSSMQGNPK